MKNPKSAGTRLGVVIISWIQLNCNIVLNRPQTILYKVMLLSVVHSFVLI